MRCDGRQARPPWTPDQVGGDRNSGGRTEAVLDGWDERECLHTTQAVTPDLIGGPGWQGADSLVEFWK